MHSRLIAIFVACCLLLASIATATAQDATPAPSPFEGLDLPTLDITVTDDAYEGIPAELAAGRYLVTVTSEVEEAWLSFIQPTTVTAEEFLTLVAASSDENADFDELLAAYNASIFPGGTMATPDQPGQVVLDLVPGEWIVGSEDSEAPQEPVLFAVTGEMPADLPEPESDATITMDEYSIDVTTGSLTAGSQVVKIENVGEQPHFIDYALGPDGITTEDMDVLIQQDMAAMGMGATPTAETEITWDDIMTVGFTPTQSRDTAMWVEITLDEPGPYVLTCWIPDVGDGAPHAAHGMFTVVEVAE
jgi:hypothetical protein